MTTKDVNVLRTVAAFASTHTIYKCRQLRLRNMIKSRLTDVEPDMLRIYAMKSTQVLARGTADRSVSMVRSGDGRWAMKFLKPQKLSKFRYCVSPRRLRRRRRKAGGVERPELMDGPKWRFSVAGSYFRAKVG